MNERQIQKLEETDMLDFFYDFLHGDSAMFEDLEHMIQWYNMLLETTKTLYSQTEYYTIAQQDLSVAYSRHKKYLIEI